MRVAWVGLGKLGWPCALVAAEKHDVVGFDVSPSAKEIITSRQYPHREIGAQELLAKTSLRVVDTVDDAVAHADLVLVAVQTPHLPEFEGTTRMPAHRADFDYAALKVAVANVAASAARQKKHIVVAVISTVLPGTSEREIYPLLNEYTSYAYSPLFIAMGTTVGDYTRPEFVLLGKKDTRAFEVVQQYYSEIHDREVVAMSVASAELTKVAYNVFLGLKIVAANTFMEISELVGANCDDVTNALAKATERVVSSKYMRGGGGDSGNCFVEGELVHVESGVRAIDEIEKGERVLGSDGRLHTVLDTYRRPFKGKVFTIKGRGLLRFTVTGEHNLYVAKDLRPVLPNGRRDQNHGPCLGEIEQVRAVDLTDDHYIVFPAPKASSQREVWTPPRAKYGPVPQPLVLDNSGTYALLAGYFMAEGNIWFDRQKNYAPTRVSFSFNTVTDGDFIAECVECLKIIAPTSTTTIKKVNARESCTEIRVHSSQLAKVLDHDFGHGYEDKHVPAWILNDDRYSAACLRGLFRGDGSSHGEGLSFSTVSPHLAHGVSLMLRRHGIASTLQSHPKRTGADGVVHRASYDLGVNNAVHIPKLAEIVGMPIHHKMQDKLYPNTIFERDGFWYHYVHSIETSDYEGTVYNINVADVHNYVSVGGLVSNCHPRDQIALSWLSRKLGMSYNLFDNMVSIREAQTKWLADMCWAKAVAKGLPIVILGKAYKKGTNLTGGSYATLLKNILDEETQPRVSVYQWDPHVDGSTFATFSFKAVFCVATDHDEFYAMSFSAGSVIIDPWGKMPDREGCEVIRVGRK